MCSFDAMCNFFVSKPSMKEENWCAARSRWRYATPAYTVLLNNHIQCSVMVILWARKYLTYLSNSTSISSLLCCFLWIGKGPYRTGKDYQNGFKIIMNWAFKIKLVYLIISLGLWTMNLSIAGDTLHFSSEPTNGHLNIYARA